MIHSSAKLKIKRYSPSLSSLLLSLNSYTIWECKRAPARSDSEPKRNSQKEKNQNAKKSVKSVWNNKRAIVSAVLCAWVCVFYPHSMNNNQESFGSGHLQCSQTYVWVCVAHTCYVNARANVFILATTTRIWILDMRQLRLCMWGEKDVQHIRKKSCVLLKYSNFSTDTTTILNI